jgi:YNFM family putative membrane transporter
MAGRLIAPRAEARNRSDRSAEATYEGAMSAVSSAPSPAEAEPPIPWRSLAMLSVAAFVSAATMRSPDSLLPEIARDLNTTPGAAGAIITSFSIAYGVFQLLYGPVGDRFGKFATVAVMTLLSSVGAAICAVMTSIEGLTVARFVLGALAAAIIPLAMAWVGDVVSYRRRQPVLARFLTGQILGLTLGQAFGGILGEYVGWRAVFWALAGMYVLAGLALLLDARRQRRQPPIAGNGPSETRPSFASMRAIVARPWPRVVLLAVTIEGFFFFGAFAFTGTHLHLRFGLPLDRVGLMLCAFGAGGLCYAMTAHRLVARLGEAGLARAGGLLLGATFVSLALLPSVWLAVPLIGLNGLGFYMIHNTLQTNGTQMAPQARGAGVALFAAVFFLGQAMGVAAAGFAVDRVGTWAPMLVCGLALPPLGLWFARRISAKPR